MRLTRHFLLATAALSACGGVIAEDSDCDGQMEDGACVHDLDYVLTISEVRADCVEGSLDNVGTVSYALRIDQGDATILVDGSQFATGRIAGCNLGYEAELDAERLPFVASPGTWTLSGSALLEEAGDACVEGDHEWESIETFSSADDGGCAYTVTATGEFDGHD